MEAEPEIITMGEKSQVIIPKNLRDHLGVLPHTKLIVFSQGDCIVLKKLSLPDVRKEGTKVIAEADRKDQRFTEAEIQGEIEAARAERRHRKTD